MILRNKKTGEIGHTIFINKDGAGSAHTIRMRFSGIYYEFNTLEEMNNVFEDYKPAEPLIKDEKVRKAVKAWVKLNGIDVVNHYLCDGSSCFVFTDEKGNDCCLDFTFRIDNLESNTDYNTTELCGEVEE